MTTGLNDVNESRNRDHETIVPGHVWNRTVFPEQDIIPWWGYVVSALRGITLILFIFIGWCVFLPARGIEWMIFGLKRPFTPYIGQFVSRMHFFFIGMGYHVQGKPMAHPGAVVANHVSWQDVLIVFAGIRVFFASKAEVRNWPLIGWLTRPLGTLYIERNRRKAKEQEVLFERRLKMGHRLCFFPEGTSTDGTLVVSFKPTLFAALFSEGLKDVCWVQPVSLIYHAPKGKMVHFYGWWGDMGFGEHIVKIFSPVPQGRVEVIYHEPVKVADFTDRKALALHCETTIRASFERDLSVDFS
ncbi:MAG: lysophospholipid acyltransferase family protein [Halocynthiibacter sp.]